MNKALIFGFFRTLFIKKVPLVRRLCEKICALLAKIMKMRRKMHICEVNGSGYGATEKNQFLSDYDVFKTGRHFEPEVELFSTLAHV